MVSIAPRIRNWTLASILAFAPASFARAELCGLGMTHDMTAAGHEAAAHERTKSPHAGHGMIDMGEPAGTTGNKCKCSDACDGSCSSCVHVNAVMPPENSPVTCTPVLHFSRSTPLTGIFALTAIRPPSEPHSLIRGHV